MASKWFLRMSVKSAEVLSISGLRMAKMDAACLYVSGSILNVRMQSVSDMELLEQLVTSIDCVARYNGHFCGVLVMPGFIYCFSDRATTDKIYFTVYKEELFVANRVDRVVRECPRIPEVNLAAWSGMLMCKNPISNETFYRDVHTASVGMLLRIRRDDGAWTYYDYDPVFRRGIVDERPIDEYAVHLLDDLTQCVTDAYAANTNRFAATLTGGMDSRLLVGLGIKAGIRPPLIIADNDSFFDEYAMIQPLLRHWRMDAQYLPPIPDYFIVHADESIGSVNSMCLAHVWFMESAKAIAQNGRLHMMGIGGGELMRAFNGNTRLTKMQTLFCEDQLQALSEIVAITEGFLPGLLCDDFLEALNGLFMESMRESMRPFWGSPRGAIDWYLQAVLFNNVVYFFSMFEDYFDGFSPYLSTEVLNRLFTLSFDSAKTPQLYTELYDRVDKELLSFPSTRNPEGKAYATPRKIHCRPVAHWIRDRLADGPLIAAGILDAQKLRDHIQAMDAKKAYTVSYDLRVLYAMDLWYREFEAIRSAKMNCV